jgi:subfamily B ATP-binding cassette protein MsbA
MIFYLKLVAYTGYSFGSKPGFAVKLVTLLFLFRINNNEEIRKAIQIRWGVQNKYCTLFSIYTIIYCFFSHFNRFLAFFLDLIFTKGKEVLVAPAHIASSQDLIKYISYQLQELKATHNTSFVLALICIMVIIAVFKNLFTYLSYYILAPMRNGVMNKLREALFKKILQMPIGYFTEQRKGDIMSRMTNDVGN